MHSTIKFIRSAAKDLTWFAAFTMTERAGNTIRRLMILPALAGLHPVPKKSAPRTDGFPAPLEPSRAHGTFQLPAEFVIARVAAEPLVEDPVAIAWDERDRPDRITHAAEIHERGDPRKVEPAGQNARTIFGQLSEGRVGDAAHLQGCARTSRIRRWV